jgi:peroxiredoxin
VERGSAAPDVALATLDGGTLALSSLRGKVVLLDFWGST